MTIVIDALTGPGDLEACEALQAAVLGERSRLILWRPTLESLLRGGGLVLGAWETTSGEPRRLRGALIDAVATRHGFSARTTLFHGVEETARNRGIGTTLRIHERALLRREEVALVRWLVDPLHSTSCRLALHRLGGIAVSYERDIYGELHDRLNLGLATDRLEIEWWLEAPRVADRVDRGAPPYYEQLGLHRMEVATKTRSAASGLRRLLSTESGSAAQYVLVEIPESLEELCLHDPPAARTWRLGTRTAFEERLANGYVGAGFLHEAGRSFHLLERGERGEILGRTSGR
jgi:predicted GNAT superfamily acetyltransferase